MSETSESDAVEKRIAAKKERDTRLEGVGFSPVVTIHAGGMFGSLGEHEHTTCRACGAVIRLGDPAEGEIDGEAITYERNIHAHLKFHARINDPVPEVD